MTTDLFDVVKKKGEQDVLCLPVCRGQSGSRVHCCHQRCLTAGVPVSANHEAAPGGLQVEILLTGTTRWPLGDLNRSEAVYSLERDISWFQTVAGPPSANTTLMLTSTTSTAD